MRKPHLMRSELIYMVLALLVVGCAATQELKAARSAEAAGDLETAFQQYSVYLDGHPRDQEARKQMERVGLELAKRLAQETQQVLAATNPPPSLPLLRQRHTDVNAKRDYDPKGVILAPLRTTIEERIARLMSEQKRDVAALANALEGGQVDEAKRLFKSCAVRDPESAEVRQLEPRFVEAYTADVSGRVKRLLAAGQVDLIVEEAAQLRELGLREENLAPLGALFDTQLDAALRERVRSDIAAKHYYSAFLLVKHSGKENLFGPELSEIRSRGGNFYLAQARARRQRGQDHYAFLQAVKGYELAPDLSGLFEMQRDMRDKVLSGMQRYIAISAFGAPQENPNLGPQFSDALISYLFRVLPYGINIVEREKIDLLMRERQREFKEVSNLLRVDWIISGNVSLMEIDRQTSPRKGKVRAKIGESTEVNPAFEEWQERSGRGEGPPQYITVPTYAEVDYEGGHVTLKAFATVSARIFDARKGAISYVQEFNARYETSDDYQQGVQGAQVQEDPLELPSDTEVQEILRGKVIEQVASVIQGEFTKRKSEFAEQAQYHIQRKESGLALRPLAEGFLYCLMSKIPYGDGDSRRLRELILELTEKDFV